jgi:hypothetical protein
MTRKRAKSTTLERSGPLNAGLVDAASWLSATRAECYRSHPSLVGGVTHSPSNTKAKEWISEHKASGREFSASADLFEINVAI